MNGYFARTISVTGFAVHMMLGCCLHHAHASGLLNRDAQTLLAAAPAAVELRARGCTVRRSVARSGEIAANEACACPCHSAANACHQSPCSFIGPRTWRWPLIESPASLGAVDIAVLSAGRAAALWQAGCRSALLSASWPLWQRPEAWLQIWLL